MASWDLLLPSHRHKINNQDRTTDFSIIKDACNDYRTTRGLGPSTGGEKWLPKETLRRFKLLE